MMIINKKRFLNTREVSKLLKIPMTTVRSYFRSGKVFKSLILVNGTRYHISEAEAVRFKAGRISVKGIYAADQ